MLVNTTEFLKMEFFRLSRGHSSPTFQDELFLFPSVSLRDSFTDLLP